MYPIKVYGAYSFSFQLNEYATTQELRQKITMYIKWVYTTTQELRQKIKASEILITY